MLRRRRVADNDSLTWGVLQERITTTNYRSPTLLSPNATERFKYPIFLNTVQSICAFLSGYLYLQFSRPANTRAPPIIPSRRLLPALILIAITSSLASPFGYASLAHIDYLTFILAKSCKLLPVMALHLTIFRKRYPLYKYAVVALVTAGVAVFTLHHPSASKKRSGKNAETSSAWGLTLLGINLLFDGLTNSTQDHIFSSFQPFSGPQMMCAQNLMTTVLTVAYLVATPYLMQVAPGVGEYFGVAASGNGGELREALAFVTRHPEVGRDVLLFSLCGAVGQVFICESPTPNAPCPKSL
jgi:UDP-galactose transporter B1